MEERTLLAEMAAVGIARAEGAEVPWETTFMPFAASVMHLLGQRSQSGVAQKVRTLLVRGPTASKSTERYLVETSELRRGDLKNRVSIKWSDTEERSLLAEMAAAGITRDEGVEVPAWRTFMPFAATVTHILGEHRSQRGIAYKVQMLLLNGPVANKLHWNSAGSGAAGLVGVFRKNERSPPRCLPSLVCWPALRRCLRRR